MKKATVNYTTLLGFANVIAGGILSAVTGLKIAEAMKKVEELDLYELGYSVYNLRLNQYGELLTNQYLFLMLGLFLVGVGGTIFALQRRKKKALMMQEDIEAAARKITKASKHTK